MSDPHDSCSMTPPLSPVSFGNLEQDEPEIIPPKRAHMEDDPVNDLPSCFCCLGEVSTQNCDFHPDGYLKQNALGRLLHGSDPNFAVFQTTCCELFGYYFTTQLALQEQMEKLFFLVRQQLNKLENTTITSTGWSLGTGSSASFMTARHYIRTFLEYVKVYVCRYVNAMNAEQFIPQLYCHLHVLLLHLGRLTELPSSVLNQCSARQGNTSTNTSYHIFHCHLDVHWGVLEIMHLITTKYPNAGISSSGQRWCQGPGVEDYSVDPSDPFQQCLQLLPWDLVVLAMKKHGKLSMKEYLSVSPFHCTCIRELWVMLRELTDYRQEHMGKNSFWITLDEILQQVLHIQQQPYTCSSEVEMDTDKFSLPPIFQCSNTTDFCWWLLHNMAPLYAYTSEGEHVSLTNPLQNNYMFLVQSLLKPLTSGEQQVDEAHLRCYMQTSLSLCKLWGPNIDVLIHLWDYFYKKLNHHFQIQGLGVEGLAKINKSAVSWLEKCKDLTKPDSRVDHMNSFQLFLKHLSFSLGEQGKNIIWKQLKGRFYSKFHPRRMQELTEIGLHNFTELFITLALIGDLEDVAGKMADFYAMLQMDNVHHGHRAVVWRGMFVLMLTYEEKGVDVSFLADKMAQEFNALCWEFSNDTLESSRRFQLWSFISMYLDCVQDVFEASDQLKLSEYKLLGRGLGQILSAVRENELRIVLNFLQLVLARHRIVYRRVSQQLSDQHQVTQQFREVADALWVTAYQFVQTHSCTLTPPPQLADVAASFTMLTLNLPPGPSTGIKEDFLSSFQYFGCNAAVSASVSCRYLNHMLPNQLVIERLSSDLKNYQPLVVQAWFKCALYLFKDNDQMQELSRLILKLPEVGELFEHVEMEASDSYSTVLVQFIVALGQSYHKTEGLMNKIKFREHASEYFGDITRHIGVILKNAGPPEALKAVYVIGGYMVKHCAQFLYVKSKPDCLLPSLLDSLVLPHVLFSASKTLNPSILQAIKDHLHLFVQGLGKLDVRRDQYIQRQLRTIFLQYLHRFPLKQSSGSTVTVVHPLVNSLSESFKASSDTSLQLRQYVFEVIRDNYLTLKGNTPLTHAGMGFTYIAEVFQKTTNQAILASDIGVLLQTMLEYQLMCEVPAIRQQSTYLTQAMLEACKKCEKQESRFSVTEILRNFISKNIKVYQLRLLKVVDMVSVLYPDVVLDLVPQLTQSLYDIEAKRGVGADTVLRQSYMNILRNLGDRGEEEILQIQNS
ncbi:protein MMS22-like [Lingula anatina]|uniref:Protein MMS22-like n=1 Tax=Lingula anatina TaxID=7574 RepID=A0A1S3HB73_LINAN|nr:protein MMS22-like [Lingula anatina]XP_013383280.1 protein MMS22-like [Lingula anatina]XP_013383281.1 protein MMS22-like [Lingula anatina]XP_013383282.1 protein MMS22-like [Lingula anatina]|eukprot:XP_013383279.1 protein MMS22-like [Lingula anatina]